MVTTVFLWQTNLVSRCKFLIHALDFTFDVSFVGHHYVLLAHFLSLTVTCLHIKMSFVR
jgi:hypothetical protein